jgi:hypothetical protein
VDDSVGEFATNYDYLGGLDFMRKVFPDFSLWARNSRRGHYQYLSYLKTALIRSELLSGVGAKKSKRSTKEV